VLSLLAIAAVAVDAAATSTMSPRSSRDLAQGCAAGRGCSPQSALGGFLSPDQLPVFQDRAGSEQQETIAAGEAAWWGVAALVWAAVLLAHALRGRWHGAVLVGCETAVVVAALTGWMGAPTTSAVMWSLFRAGWAAVLVRRARAQHSPAPVAVTVTRLHD